MSRERERIEEIVKKIKRESDALAAADHHHQSNYQMGGGRRLMTALGPPAAGGTLNTITPCAACKLLRRRCAQECPFSPYFSPHEPQKFACVHKVFGASNVSKMLMEVPESQRVDAANSLVYEANVRLRDPVYGCMGAISALQQQVQLLQSELNAVRAEILKYKYNGEINLQLPSQITMLSSGTISIAAPPPPPPPPPRPPPPLTPSNSSPIYTQVITSSAAADFNSNINSNENISYFG